MNLLQSTQPAFRYRWRATPQIRLPGYLSATCVAVLELDPAEAYERIRLKLENLKCKTFPLKQGNLALEEVGCGAQELSRQIREGLAANDLHLGRGPSDLEPLMGLFQDTVDFHVDMPLWGSVFGTWCLHGPERTLSFPMMGLTLPFRPGTFVLFDPAQPHGVFKPEPSETEGEAVAMLNVILPKKGVLADLLGCEQVPEDESGLFQTEDQYKPDPKTGLIKLLEPALSL